MITVNNVSGGKTSAYLAVHYPADYNLFSLVRTMDKKCIFPDPKVRQIVSDKINAEFVGTLEMDEIIYTILDLEQYMGRPINWVTGEPFEEVIRTKKGLPSIMQRYCTSLLKIEPLKKFWYENIGEPVEVRLGFRANEQRRAKTMLENTQEDGFLYDKFIVGRNKTNTRNKWQTLKWQKPAFPLIENAIFKDTIENYWKDKPVRFAYMNNCVGCFHRSPMLLKHMSTKASNKFDWFVQIEKEQNEVLKQRLGRESQYGRFLDTDLTYEQIKNHKLQLQLFDEDFNSCDSGYCGM